MGAPIDAAGEAPLDNGAGKAPPEDAVGETPPEVSGTNAPLVDPDPTGETIVDFVARFAISLLKLVFLW